MLACYFKQLAQFCPSLGSPEGTVQQQGKGRECPDAILFASNVPKAVSCFYLAPCWGTQKMAGRNDFAFTDGGKEARVCSTPCSTKPDQRQGIRGLSTLLQAEDPHLWDLLQIKVRQRGSESVHTWGVNSSSTDRCHSRSYCSRAKATCYLS